MNSKGKYLALVSSVPTAGVALFFYTKYLLLGYDSGCGGWQVGGELIILGGIALLCLVICAIIFAVTLIYQKIKGNEVREYYSAYFKWFIPIWGIAVLALIIFLFMGYGSGGCL